MKQVVLAGVAMVVLVGSVRPVSAQGFIIYMPPICELDTQHFLVRNAELYVKVATEARSEEQRARSITDAKRVLMDALDGGEEMNPAVWYFLGRTHALSATTLHSEYHEPVPPGRDSVSFRDSLSGLWESELIATDSAFTKAKALFPECGDDIDNQRRFLWVPLYNEGADALGSDDLVTAREAFRKADLISDDEPFVPYYLASVLVSEGDVAGALRLFKKTIAMGQREGDYEESYVTSLFNAGRLHHMLEQWDSAAVWYAEYRQVVPEDSEALTGMLQVLEAAGRDEDALAFTDTILAHADVLTDIDIFSAGVALFQADRFEASVRAFLVGLEKNGHYRDGVYNLAQSYFALANPAGREEGEDVSPDEEKARDEAAKLMLEASQRLVEIDPSSENPLRLLAAAYQLTGDTASTRNLLEQMEELTFDVKVELFQSTDGGYQVQGTISNLKEEDTIVPDVVFEFVDAEGEVVTVETVSGTTLAPKGSARFELNPIGDGIAAWRYKVAG